MNPMNIAKVNTLPATFQPNTVYFVKSATTGVMELYLSDSTGSDVRKIPNSSEALGQAITRATSAPALPHSSPFFQNTTTNVLFYQKSVSGTVSWAPVTEISKQSVLVSQASAPTLPSETSFWNDSATGIIHYQKTIGSTTTWQALSRFDTYSLRVDTSTGAIDANTTQVIKIDNSTATTKTINVSNAPAGRAATFVIKIIGNAGTLSFTNTIGWDSGAQPSLGATFTVITLFWDGSAFTGCAGHKA